jgi:ribosomal protein S12 methylthiotransferase
MGRQYTAKDLTDLFEQIRGQIPEAVLRTTVITGFPGETENDFSQLMDFIQRIQFDHLGAFTYSDAEDLASHPLPNPVLATLARDRSDRLMALQMTVSAEKNQQYLDKTIDVLVEENSEPGLWIGRTPFQAPEVDGITYIKTGKGPDPMIGDFARVKVIDAMEYDLVAETNDEHPA